MDRLIREVGQAVASRILGANESVDDVARELHERLLLRNENTKKVVIESIYRESEEARHNVQVFMNAPSLQEARPHLKKVGRHVVFGYYLITANLSRFEELVSRKSIYRLVYSRHTHMHPASHLVLRSQNHRHPQPLPLARVHHRRVKLSPILDLSVLQQMHLSLARPSNHHRSHLQAVKLHSVECGMGTMLHLLMMTMKMRTMEIYLGPRGWSYERTQ